MIPSIKDIEEFLELCQNGYEKAYETGRYLAETELTRRRSTGRKQKYTGDAKERNNQAVKRHRELKKLEEAKNKHLMQLSEKNQRRLAARQRTADEEPIDLRPKRRKRKFGR